jgi:16S rRNA (guanine527-N7)-methyltransferase
MSAARPEEEETAQPGRILPGKRAGGARPPPGDAEAAPEPAPEPEFHVESPGAVEPEALDPGALDAGALEEVPGARSEDPDAVLLHKDSPLPSRDELRAALAWAFEREEAPEALLDRFAHHAELVLRGNQRMNLTAIVDCREVAAKHYLDSWRATRLLPLVGRGILDLGTGAGFPGIPVGMGEPQARVVVLDSTRKRIDFVTECLRELELGNVSAVWDRAEEHLARHRYDIVLVRAVSSVRENVRLLRKVKHSHKDLVMLKGSSWSREVRAAEREAERLGFHLDTVWEHDLPGEMGKRAILVYRAPGGQGA